MGGATRGPPGGGPPVRLVPVAVRHVPARGRELGSRPQPQMTVVELDHWPGVALRQRLLPADGRLAVLDQRHAVVVDGVDPEALGRAARIAARSHPQPVVDLRPHEDVEPAGEVEDRDPHPVARVAAPVEPVRAREEALADRQVEGGGAPDPERGVDDVRERAVAPVERVRLEVEQAARRTSERAPPDDGVEVGHGAGLAPDDPDHARGDRAEGRVTAHRRGPLCEPVVRLAEHPDRAVRPALPDDPVEGVEAVRDLPAQVEDALGAELAANVLRDHGVAVLPEDPGNERHDRVLAALVVRETDQDHRLAAPARR